MITHQEQNIQLYYTSSPKRQSWNHRHIYPTTKHKTQTQRHKIQIDNNMTALILFDMNTHTTMLSPKMTQPEATLSTVGCKRRIHHGTEYLPKKKMRINRGSSSTISNGKKRRTVHFSTDVPTVHVVPLVPNEDMQLVWYTTPEFHHQRRSDFHWCRFYAQGEDDTYRNNLFEVLGTACGKLDHTTATEDACLALSSSHIRGLERETTVCFRQRKKQVVANVLKSQASLRVWKKNQDEKMGDKESTDYASRILAAHYHKLAQPAGRFARLLGKGDGQLAACLRQQDTTR